MRIIFFLQGTELFYYSQTTQNKIKTSFFWGYIITQVPGGILSDKFGGKFILAIGLLLSSALTLAIPSVAGRIYWLLTLRVIIGCGQVCSMYSTSSIY